MELRMEGEKHHQADGDVPGMSSLVREPQLDNMCPSQVAEGKTSYQHNEKNVGIQSVEAKEIPPIMAMKIKHWAKHHILSSSSLGLLLLVFSILLLSIFNINDLDVHEQIDSLRFIQQHRIEAAMKGSILSVEDSKATNPVIESVEEEDESIIQRRLGKHHHHKHKHKPIDYTIYSCSSMQQINTKYPDRFDRCEFAKNCDDGDGIIFPTLFCDDEDDAASAAVASVIGKGHHWPHGNHHALMLTLLALILLLLFRLLNSTTDEFFSPGLELFSLKLGLPPRFAGVTLLALGNGAPDVAATMNAILEDERHGYEMALGELTGTSMFVSGVILGVIVSLSGTEEDEKVKRGNKEGNGDATGAAEKKIIIGGVPCRGPLLRDISVLILVCVVSMSYLKVGVIDYGFVYTMLGMYVIYVLMVLGADAYHIFYHAPSLPSTTIGKTGSQDIDNECQEMTEKDQLLAVSGTAATKKDEEKGCNTIIDEQTPLVSSTRTLKKSFFRSGSAPTQPSRGIQRNDQHFNNTSHHLSLHGTNAYQQPAHSHTLSETVIEAMSNYSCHDEPLLSVAHSHESNASDQPYRNGSDLDGKTSSPRISEHGSSSAASIFKSRGWAPMQEDGTEPLVIFHPHHAVHPHHGQGGLLFLRSKSAGAGAHYQPTVNRRQHSWSVEEKMNNERRNELKKASSCDTSLILGRGHNATTTGAMQITSKSSSNAISEDNDDDSFDKQDNGHSSADSALELHNKKPDSWREAISANCHEFMEHWHDFFRDIYRNEENSVLDVILLSVELPFTILRKLTNPVPCDGYYCRPLVAVSLALSPLWLWYYFLDQFGINIFSSYVGHVLSCIPLAMGLIVARYAPGGEGPMDVYMVVPLTLYGFTIAATWLDSIADKLVQLLELFGILLRIPSTIMGLTVLAFGNSLQDLVANVSLSKKGLSTMATTACLAGPIFNLCVGLGFGFWALMKSTGKTEIHVELPRNIATGFWFTIANCGLIVFAGVVVGKGVIGQGYGYVACGLYVVYVVTSLFV